MTSANLSGQPIIKDNAEALEKLASIADGFLLHDRGIHVHCDDSVVRLFSGAALPLRRSRGYAPFPVQLPFDVEPTLAVGGELKSTFCLASGDQAIMSQHIGDMENLETLDAFDKAVEHMQAIFRIEPASVVCDEHPGYLSTRWAESAISGSVVSGSGVNRPGVNESLASRSNSPIKRQLHKVQHHHAHIAAVMAENGVGRDEQVIGFAFDGTGYGREATTGEESIWGGEILRVGYADYKRVAHLKNVPLPGGNAAILKPYRMALAHLWAAGVEWDEVLPSVTACSQAERAILRQQLERQINTVGTSSMGRLFDAVAALAGVRQNVSYEAQAAIELESLAKVSSAAALDTDGYYAFQLPRITAEAALEQPISYSATPVIQSVVQDVRQGISTEVIAIRFHRAVANLVADMALSIREATTLNRVGLSGGVFQNVLLLELATTALKANGFEVVTHRLVPPNDGGLALGQVVVANAKLQENNHEISGRIPRP